MKTQKSTALAGILAVFAITLGILAACETPTGPSTTGNLQLPGTISISPNTGVNIDTELTANYSGNKTVSYQWNKDGTAIPDATSNKYTPTAAGSYTVTVSAAGYNSKTSAIVDVNDPSLSALSGDITISPNIGVTTGIQLTASYSGPETDLSYQWRKDGVNVGTNSTQYTPTAAGSYTVTVGAAGYNSKTSAAVTVTGGNVPPENLPAAERWYSWVDDSATATVNYSVDGDGVCTITVGGIAQPNNETDNWGKWKANAAYRYTVKANTCYTYVFEAWTQSGDREVHCQYYTDNDEEVYMGNDITLTETLETYTIKGNVIPKSGVQAFEFHCADQLGTFYVKILAIYAYTPSLEYELINDIDSPNNGTYRVVSATGMSGAVVIPATYKNLPVTEIGENAFNGNTSLTGITIPASVTEIGWGAFWGCKSLATVTFAPNSQLETIDDRAFMECSLTSITIPANVTEIGGWAFADCKSLTSITIPASVISISDAFTRCKSLTSITVNPNNPNYSSQGGILYNKDKTELLAYPSASGTFTIPASVTSIGWAAFTGNENITTVAFAAGSQLETIGNWAFENCTSLTSITIPEGVTMIFSGAFYYCPSLISITIPASVTTIGGQAFDYCYSLTSITVNANNPYYASEGGILYNKEKTEIRFYPSASGNVIIPDNVTSIGEGAFSQCALTSITIPDNVTSIGWAAFFYCTSLTNITIPASTTVFVGPAFIGWNPSQTIYVKGYASEAEADLAWGEYWRDDCNAVIKYWNGSAYQ